MNLKIAVIMNKISKAKFLERINKDYSLELIKKNIGDEIRTYWEGNKSDPLLSPSRIIKEFTSHIFSSIPLRYLEEPILFGKVVHKILEEDFKELFNWNKFEDILFDANPDLYFKYDTLNDLEKLIYRDKFITAIRIIKKYLKENNIEILAMEKIIHDKRYWGIIDIVGMKDGDTPIIIDLKTTTKPKLTNSHIAQLSIYRELFIGIPQALILFYDKNNEECFLEEVSEEDLEETFNKIEEFTSLFRKERK